MTVEESSPRRWGSLAIGVDVGATTTRVGAVDENGTIYGFQRFDTPQCVGADAFMSTILEAVKNVQVAIESNQGMLTSIGLAVPCSLSSDRSRVVRCINLPFLEGVSVAVPFEADLAVRCHVATDAEAATWAEYAARERDAERFAHLRIGTGVGLGVVIDGQLQRLDSDRTTHADILVVDRSSTAPPCPCGRRGCLEVFASGPALQRSLLKVGQYDGLGGLQEAIALGDEEAWCVVTCVAQEISHAILNVVERFRVQTVCLGGGVIEHLPCIVEAVRKAISQSNRACSDKTLAVEPSRCGDDAGVLGAAFLSRR